MITTARQRGTRRAAGVALFWIAWVAPSRVARPENDPPPASSAPAATVPFAPAATGEGRLTSFEAPELDDIETSLPGGVDLEL